MGTCYLYENGPLVDMKYYTRVTRGALFVRDNWTGASGWTFGGLCNWLGWCWHAGCVEMAVTGAGRIEGMGVARPVEKPTKEDRYALDHHAGNVHVDLLIAKTAEARRYLWRVLVARFGERDTVSFHHHRRAERLVIHQFNRYNELIQAL